MIAKLIVHAPNRSTAAARLAGICRSSEIWPVKTNAAFLANALSLPDFIAGGSGLRQHAGQFGIDYGSKGERESSVFHHLPICRASLQTMVRTTE